jgi:hypothetical protein
MKATNESDLASGVAALAIAHRPLKTMQALMDLFRSFATSEVAAISAEDTKTDTKGD